MKHEAAAVGLRRFYYDTIARNDELMMNVGGRSASTAS